MIPLEIVYSRKAISFLKRSSKEANTRIRTRIVSLSNVPYPSSSAKVKRYSGKVFRIRIGKHRVLYEINQNQMHVLLIEKREQAYKQ